MECLNCNQEMPKNFSIFEFLVREKQEQGLCNNCKKDFILLKGKTCLGCAKLSEETYCEDCRSWQEKYPEYPFSHQALYQYNEAMKEYFARYKFKGDYRLRYMFTHQIRQALKKEKATLIPIPLSSERYLERGFNQVEGFLDAARLDYVEALIKKDDEQAQSHKNKKERLTTKQPFLLKEDMKHLLKDKEIIIVDDIYTTGRTLFHAYEEIQKSDPKSIRTFSLAR
ncbi:MAG: ComF family protein [Streptococcaceae bacterium]|jgi:competence protein ComFC|nr:ComF family protein [Streptococcaceae bacterium]